MVDVEQTRGELVAAAADEFTRAGFSEPRREASRLWADLFETTLAEATLGSTEPVSAEVTTHFSDAVRRRMGGEPLAYVTGWTGFRRLTLRCDRRALIPRPETEGLVEAALTRARSGVAVDVGTGTGAIALALSDEGDFDEVIGVDLSPGALALAHSNGVGTGQAVSWLEGDLLAPLAGRQVDLLVSNPPYLTQVEHDTLDRSVRDYEPALALIGGADGQHVVGRLLREGPAVVKPGGWIALEVDCRRADDAGRIAGEAGWTNVKVLDDLFGRARYLLAQQRSGS
jgi:release factor glutamine methyltransferase